MQGTGPIMLVLAGEDVSVRLLAITHLANDLTPISLPGVAVRFSTKQTELGYCQHQRKSLDVGPIVW